VAAPAAQALVLRGQVAVLGSGGGVGGLGQRRPQPLGALARLAGAAFAGGLIVAGADAGPGGEVLRRRERVHVESDAALDSAEADRVRIRGYAAGAAHALDRLVWAAAPPGANGGPASAAIALRAPKGPLRAPARGVRAPSLAPGVPFDPDERRLPCAEARDAGPLLP
jgi:hypothetical protein